MARTDPQINIRLPLELKERIRIIGDQNGRSMNAEIVHRLEQSFEAEAKSAETPDKLEQLLSKHMRSFEKRVLERVREQLDNSEKSD